MSNQRIIKKSIFGGFKKEDVINYIEQLQKEIAELKKTEFEFVQLKNDYEILNNKLAQAEQNFKFSCQQIDSLKQEKAQLLSKEEEYVLHEKELSSIIEDYERKVVSSEAKISLLEHNISELQDSYARVDEAEKYISDIKMDAGNSVLNTKNEISSAQDRIKTACVNFDSALSSLKSSTDILVNVLDIASERLGSVE